MPPSRCSACDQVLPADGRFCPRCGKPRDGSGPTATATASSWTSSADSGERFPPGTMLAGRYRIVGRLGRGGMGEVFRADDMKLGQPVALKFLPPEVEGHDSTLARFHHEVRIARQVSHPNVCRVYDIGEVDGKHFISMEYVDGEDLRSLLRRIGRLPSDKAVQIARQLCAGVAAAHDKGVLHRDLKPANVMLDGEGRVRVTDFGLAAIAGEVQGLDVRSGTPGYMAPEQLEGRDVSVASDVYALGLVLFELFTGKPAFRASSVDELLRQQRSDVTSPSSHVEGLDPAVERVILRCLAPHPAERPPSALAVAAALPGGDPLAAALAAGETPSPEMVAASVVVGALRPLAAWGLLAFVTAGVAAIVFVGGRGTIAARVGFEKEPQVLVAEARGLLRSAGHTDEPADEIWGFARNDDYLAHLRETDASDPWAAIGPGGRAALFFFYREAPRPLVPLDLASNRMSLDDPPARLPGTATVWLDAAGRLVRMEVLPPERVDPEPPASVEVDWKPMLDAAGLASSPLRKVDPSWNPPFAFDRRAAWTGDALRVEAASYRGSPVYFRVVGPWETPFDPGVDEPGGAAAATQVAVGLLFCATLLGAFILARRNLKLGRSDRRGAFRIAAVFTGLHMLAWMLYAKHAGGASDALAGLLESLAVTLFEGLMIYTLYLALEPAIRRRWPDTIVSWTRLLAGRARDPLVGRDLLFGCGLGVGLSLWVRVFQAFPGWIGLAIPEPRQTELAGLAAHRTLLGEFLDSQIHAIVPAMAVLILLLLVSMVVRRVWLAGLLIVALTAALSLPVEDSWVLAVGGAGYVAVVLFSLTRFGLLSGTVLWAVSSTCDRFVFTTDVGAWYGLGAGLAVAWVLSLAGTGFHLALAGRPMFGSGWLQD